MLKEQKMRRAIPFMIAMLVAGCQSTGGAGPAASSPTYTPIVLNAEQITAVQDGARSSLKDPDSARFGSTFRAARANDKSQAIFVCGFVNSKNSFGGYVGMQPFNGMLADMATKNAAGKSVNVRLFTPLLFGSDEASVTTVMHFCTENNAAI